MDSITQIVLGAACGEAALGKKIGNKALLFGAIGGTIPDLDVFVGGWLYGNEIDAMLFHRGFMHSILFTILGTFLFGWLTHKIYEKLKKVKILRIFFTFFNKFWLTGFIFKLYVKYSREPFTLKKDWIWLFFLSLFTHPLLDAFTPYGTQLFAPFSNYRVAFNNISVADPVYTVPFLLCLIILMFFKRHNSRRQLWLQLGFGISSAYMLFTLGNKLYMDTVFKKSFSDNQISFSRFSTQPTILNNILWYGIAETDSDYYVGFYSLLDKSDKVENIIKIPKQHSLIDINHPDIQYLSWFSNGYFNLKQKDSSIQYIDMRYPLLNEDDPESSVFVFDLVKENNRWDIKPFYGEPPSSEDFNSFIERVKGK